MRPDVRVLRIGLLALLGIAPGVALAGVIERPYSVAVAAGVAAAAAIAVGLLAPRLAPRWLTVVVAAGELAVVVAVVAIAPRRGDEQGFVFIASDALSHGWSALLTSPVPADPSARMLVPLAIVVWLATASAVALAHRTAVSAAPRPVVALVPPAFAFVAGCIAAGREQFHPIVVGCAVAVVAASFLATFRPRPDARARVAGSRTGARRRTSTRTLAATTAGALALAVLGGALIGPSLAFGRDAEPFDPRDRIDPPTVPSGATSPLELFASRQKSGADPMFVVTSAEPVNTRLVALESFDGARWTSALAYRPSGTVIEPVDRTGAIARTVTATIRVDGLTGPWLPVTGDPTRVEGVSFLYEPSSGSLLAASGDALGAEYRIEAVVNAADVATLQSLPVATDEEANAARELPPGMPTLLSEMATSATAGGTTPFLTAALLQRYLRLTFERDDDFTAGHSYGHLQRAFTEVGSATEEQFASAFAVLGRAVGLPTRVSVGFGPGEQQADGTYRVRAGDARVWPEVKFAGAGWVAFDPSPPKVDIDGVDVPIGPGGAQGIIVQEADAVEAIDGGPPPPAEPATSDGGPSWSTIALVVIGALVVVSLAGAVATWLVKRGRTRRRRVEGGPTERVVGAWTDVLDRFAEIERTDPRDRTVEDLVERPHAATSALTGLYRPVLRALYDADDGCTDADAEQAWRARDRFVRAARREAGLVRRTCWAIDPRPLAPARSRTHHRRPDHTTHRRRPDPAATIAAASPAAPAPSHRARSST